MRCYGGRGVELRIPHSLQYCTLPGLVATSHISYTGVGGMGHVTLPALVTLPAPGWGWVGVSHIAYARVGKVGAS